jgi:hypothetical protein
LEKTDNQIKQLKKCIEEYVQKYLLENPAEKSSILKVVSMPLNNNDGKVVLLMLEVEISF